MYITELDNEEAIKQFWSMMAFMEMENPAFERAKDYMEYTLRFKPPYYLMEAFTVEDSVDYKVKLEAVLDHVSSSEDAETMLRAFNNMLFNPDLIDVNNIPEMVKGLIETAQEASEHKQLYKDTIFMMITSMIGYIISLKQELSAADKYKLTRELRFAAVPLAAESTQKDVLHHADLMNYALVHKLTYVGVEPQTRDLNAIAIKLQSIARAREPRLLFREIYKLTNTRANLEGKVQEAVKGLQNAASDPQAFEQVSLTHKALTQFDETNKDRLSSLKKKLCP